MDENRELCGCLGVVLAQTRSKCDMKELGSDPDVDYYTTLHTCECLNCPPVLYGIDGAKGEVDAAGQCEP